MAKPKAPDRRSARGRRVWLKNHPPAKPKDREAPADEMIRRSPVRKERR